MQIATVTTKVSPDMGELPIDSYTRQPKWWVAIPVCFWLAVFSVIAVESFKGQQNSRIKKEVARIATRIEEAKGQESALQTQLAVLSRQREAADKIAAWVSTTPMLQPVVAATVKALSGVARINMISLDRKPGDEPVFILAISFADDSENGAALAHLRQNLNELGWKLTEGGSKPNGSSVVFTFEISPQ